MLKDNESDSLTVVGIPFFVEALRHEDGERYLAACEYLNVKNWASRSEADTVSHLQSFFDFYNKAPDDMHKAALQLASAFARMYLFGMSCIEFTSLLMGVTHWADGVPRDSHPSAVGRWKIESDNFETASRRLQERLRTAPC